MNIKSINGDGVLQPTLFDYAALEPEARIVVQQEDKEFDDNMNQAGSSFLKACHNVKRIHEALKYKRPGFVDWANSKTGLSKSAAYRMVDVAKMFPTVGNIQGIGRKALYLLASPSTPEPARLEALDLAREGQVVGFKSAKDIVNQHKDTLNRMPPPRESEYTFEHRFDEAWEDSGEWACSDCGNINAPFASECAGCVRVNPPQSAEFNVLHSSESNEWYTPEVYIEASRTALRGIDLDPASCESANETVRARTIFTKEDDGLSQPWFGSVFLNPPYGKTAGQSNQGMWAEKLISEYESGNVNQAILLVNAAPSNKWFAPLWDYPICFTKRRIQFDSPFGGTESATHSNCFVYFGDDIDQFKSAFDDLGVVAVRYRGNYA